jgi:hypothetical protein
MPSSFWNSSGITRAPAEITQEAVDIDRFKIECGVGNFSPGCFSAEAEVKGAVCFE